MFRNCPAILVVEDQPFIAIDVALAIEDAGGEVMGPAASVAHALDLLTRRTPAGAILDVNLIDGLVSPVVDRLIELGVPLVIQTGVGLPPGLAARHPDLVVLIKPVLSGMLVERLEGLMAAGVRSGGGLGVASGSYRHRPEA